MGRSVVLGACISRRRGGGLLNFCGPKTGSNGPVDPATYLRGHLAEKNVAPTARPGATVSAAGTGGGQRHRRVARGPPPTTPLGGWSPQVPTTASEAKTTAQGGPWVHPPKPKS
jgi:hypothetical protein